MTEHGLQWGRLVFNIMDKKQFYLLYEKKEGKAEG